MMNTIIDSIQVISVHTDNDEFETVYKVDTEETCDFCSLAGEIPGKAIYETRVTMRDKEYPLESYCSDCIEYYWIPVRNYLDTIFPLDDKNKPNCENLIPIDTPNYTTDRLWLLTRVCSDIDKHGQCDDGMVIYTGCSDEPLHDIKNLACHNCGNENATYGAESLRLCGLCVNAKYVVQATWP